MAACQTRIIKDVWCLSDACCCIDETEYTADEETLPSFALHKRTQAADHAPSGDTLLLGTQKHHCFYENALFKM